MPLCLLSLYGSIALYLRVRYLLSILLLSPTGAGHGAQNGVG